MFKDLLELAAKRKTKLIASCILSILSAGISVVPFLLMYRLLLELFGPSPESAWPLVALLPVVYILTYILLIYAYDLSHRAAYEILYEVRLELGERMTRLPLGYFDERNTGELETIMNENVERLEFFLAHHFIEMVTAAFIPIFLALLLFVWDWRMALASVLPPLVALGAIFFISGRRWPGMVERFLAAQSRVNAAIVEYTQGIKAIKAFGQTAESFQKYQQNMAAWRDSLDRWNRETALPFTLYQAFITSTLVVIIPVGLWLYRQGALSLEMFLLFLFLGPTFGIQFMLIYQFLRFWLEERECKKYALQDISFHVPQGTVCALVGPSGAGKTTIARLILRFWDVDEGEVLIGEYNVKDIPLDRLLSFISVVFQDVFLFNDTVLENIRLGRPEATEEEVRAAARAARCDEFIEGLPDGYHTVIGEKGVSLSADRQPGQGQDGAGHRPQAFHHHRCKPDPGHRKREDRGAGKARGAGEGGRALQQDVGGARLCPRMGDQDMRLFKELFFLAGENKGKLKFILFSSFWSS